ncbi:MAG: hypothetical protein NC299_01275 [Lachnospiraceae bacterium]|nr:hypothetical protein [Ruminococcus sp.]MCM1273980.1 hypothetical protein [Lachnospiraceae bacterium]
MGNFDKFNELRERHPRFIYHDFELNEERSELRFHFQIDEFHFRPVWSFNFKLADRDFDRRRAEEIAFSLGMAELVSYWKCACCPTVEVRCGGLSDWRKNWWKKLYFNGLGEFFYRNGIGTDFSSFMTIEAPEACELPKSKPSLSGALVPVGGGKDSVVTLELLKKAGEDVTPYIINAGKAALGCVEAAGLPLERVAGPTRVIDSGLLERNKAGWLNGHTPFSAVVAFSAMLHACFLGKRYIVLSNESSANETYVDGAMINHQYSKSTEFERDFREYCAEAFGECPEYFSLLRPLSEWQIAREFVKYPQYFPVFQSCNLGAKTNVWCCSCAKCLYVYILLAAFLDDGELTKIFGCDMLEKTELAEMLDGLTLDGEDKPFECVGTKDEVRLALKMALDRRREKPPALLRRFEKRFPDYRPVDLTKYFDGDNFVPERFLPYLERIINEI